MAEAAAAAPGRFRTIPDGAGTEPDNDGTGSGGFGGRALDVAAAAAGVVLVLIAADMLTGGKLSRWLLRRGCAGCSDQDHGHPQATEGGGGDS